jgi:hypothetical protein
MPYLEAFSDFREEVRQVAREQKGWYILYKIVQIRQIFGPKILKVVRIKP